MNFIKRKIVIIPLGFVLILSLLWINRYSFFKIYNMQQFYKASPKKMIEANEKAFMEDRDILGRYELFFPSKGTSDAGPFLNPRVHWEIGEIHHQGDLVLPEFVHKELKDDWVTKKPLFKKMGLNFQWMKELAKYDYWNPEEGSPAYPAGKKYETYSFPIPTYKDLMTWAKLRYLYGKETGDVQSALKEVRHLMRLIWTNDYLVSSMVVVAMLKIENQFEEILTPKEIGDWKFIPTEHVMRAKRHFYSLPITSDIRLPDELFNRLTRTSVGICPMLNESAMTYIGMREFLGEELKYGMDRFHELVRVSNCRRSYVFRIWENPNWQTFTSLEGVKIWGNDVMAEKVKSDPDYKATVGFIIASIAYPVFWQYEKPLK